MQRPLLVRFSTFGHISPTDRYEKSIRLHLTIFFLCAAARGGSSRCDPARHRSSATFRTGCFIHGTGFSSAAGRDKSVATAAEMPTGNVVYLLRTLRKRWICRLEMTSLVLVYCSFLLICLFVYLFFIYFSFIFIPVYFYNFYLFFISLYFFNCFLFRFFYNFFFIFFDFLIFFYFG